MRKKTPIECICIDLGSGFMVITTFNGRRFEIIKCPTAGPAIPTVAYRDPKTGAWSIGRKALMKCIDDSGDNLFQHAKRNFLESPEKKLYGGEFTPIDIFTQILKYAINLISAARPDLVEQYPQLGGNKRSADDLAIIFTIPANWGLETQSHYETAIRAAGFRDFDGFTTEPMAGARRSSRVSSIELNDGAKLLVVDVGAGTTDIAILQYRRGKFDQLAAASGDAYCAGHDYTAKLTEAIAKKHRIPWKDVYGKGGLNFSGASAKLRPQILSCWTAAELAKRQLSVDSEATIDVQLARGRKTSKVTLEEATKLWQPLYASFRKCVSSSLEGTNLTFGEIDVAMLVGGSSMLPGLRQAMADVIKRDISDVIVCTDSTAIVAEGGAEHGFYQDETAQALESGLGFSVIDAHDGKPKHLLFVAPGTVIPPEGHFLEHSGAFQVTSAGAKQSLLVEPFICRTGVRASVVDGRDTTLSESEILPLQPVDAVLDGFPTGDHPLSLALRVDPNRRPWLLCQPDGLPDLDTISIPLTMREANGVAQPDTAYDILLMLDASRSMAGDKLANLKKGASEFANYVIGRGANLGIIVFQMLTAELTCEFSQNLKPLRAGINAIKANGRTPMAEAIQCATTTFKPRVNGAVPIGVMFTDGKPHEMASTYAAAEEFKSIARLITVGIGSDVQESFLTSLASSPSDYCFARAPEDILEAFSNVARILYRGGSPAGSAPGIPVATRPQSQKRNQQLSSAVDSSAYDDDCYESDWDEIAAEEANQ